MACEQETQDVTDQIAVVALAVAAVNVATLTLNGKISQLNVETGILAAKLARLDGCLQ